MSRVMQSGFMGLFSVLIGLGILTADEPSWPKVDVAISYRVDPDWPQRPEGMRWADMAGIAVDAHDNVYCFTRTDPPVQVFDREGRFLRAWGRDLIKSAHHLKIDREGNVWTTDVEWHLVRKFTPEGKLLLTLGTPQVAGSDERHFNMPTDVAFASNGDVFVADGYGNARIVHFDKDGKFIKQWGELGSRPGQFSIPHAIAIDSKDRIYVADRNNVRIQVFDTSGKLLDVWNNLVTPWGLWMLPNDELWVCGSSPMTWRPEDSTLGVPPKDQLFMRFNSQGKLLQLWTVPKGIDGLERPGELNWVHCIAVDSQGNLYAGDIRGKRAQKFRRIVPQ
ncbi:MAG: peptidyl-alpha-hydroxyglycine alpha-amidating lyase family protein [Gemmatales bacterium]|nr:peptidyl-alpha-hydroxyglycine alpha-amidating lyase family protein [Gemmatales bacterium]MDW8387206.1 peptidyl-alpha-hydroxyglycine alpha-amidating lyase family protein [Gemmatales bacterium]